jgi:hypothetical protein
MPSEIPQARHKGDSTNIRRTYGWDGWASVCVSRCELLVKAMKAKRPHPKRLFKDSWRPEDKALESAEEEALERDYGEEIARDRARRHKQTPAIAGFDKAPPPASEPGDPPPRDR